MAQRCAVRFVGSLTATCMQFCTEAATSRAAKLSVKASRFREPHRTTSVNRTALTAPPPRRPAAPPPRHLRRPAVRPGL